MREYCLFDTLRMFWHFARTGSTGALLDTAPLGRDFLLRTQEKRRGSGV